MIYSKKDKTPRRTVISKRGRLTWSSEDMDSLTQDINQASTPKKMRLSRLNSREEMTVQIKNANREGQKTLTTTVVTSECTKWVLTELVI